MTNPSHNLSYSDVTILIPTLNEAPTIGQVIDGFTDQGFDHICVIDGNSTDATRTIAEEHGATVYIQSQKGTGKGAAVIEAVTDFIQTEYFVVIDGDATYDPSEVDKLLKPLEDGYHEVVGNRFANIQDGAMKPLHQFGNKAINTVYRLFTPGQTPDILSGYRAYHTQTLQEFPLEKERFGIETELSTRFAYSDYNTAVVPITYRPRPADSEAELNSFSDGFDILKTLFEIRHQSR